MKKYNWEEINSLLKSELKKTKHILTFGTMGSCNIEKDIDIIITKKPASPSSDFFKEVHNLFEIVDKYLSKEYNAKLIRTSRFSDEEEIKYLAKFKLEDLVFQVLTYVSLKQIELHWYSDLNSGENIKDILKKNYNCILGNANDLFKPGFNYHKNENLFIDLNDSDRINSHFPKELLIRRMNVLSDYILRKRLGLKTLIANSEEEVKKIFYQIGEILDN